jgi:hypothetical protein
MLNICRRDRHAVDTFREYRVRSWPVRSALRIRGSSLSSSKSALMSAIAASCCTEESFESSSKNPMTEDTADDIASDIFVTLCREITDKKV